MLPTAVTDDSLDRYYPADPGINKGTVGLWDFSNSLIGVSGVPANGATIKNLALDALKGMAPSATEANSALTVVNTLVAGQSLAELTPKKALHVIPSQVSETAGQNDLVLNLPMLIVDLMIDRPTHEFFVDYVFRKTRPALTTNSADFGVFISPTQGLFIFLATGTAPSSTNNAANLVGQFDSVTPLNQVNDYYRDICFKGFMGSIPADRTTLYRGFKFGSGSSAFGGLEGAKAPAHALREIYIEDLTISGRSYQTASQDRRVRCSTKLATGGKWNGDSYIDPATLP